jgi:hypothetical protein
MVVSHDGHRYLLRVMPVGMVPFRDSGVFPGFYPFAWTFGLIWSLIRHPGQWQVFVYGEDMAATTRHRAGGARWIYPARPSRDHAIKERDYIAEQLLTGSWKRDSPSEEPEASPRKMPRRSHDRTAWAIVAGFLLFEAGLAFVYDRYGNNEPLGSSIVFGLSVIGFLLVALALTALAMRYTNRR